MAKLEKEINFWDTDGYKVDTQRIHDNINQIEFLSKYFDERAVIEAEYAKKLRTWNEKMMKNIEKSSFYGTHKTALTSITMQSEKMASHHQQIHDKMLKDCSSRVGVLLIHGMFKTRFSCENGKREHITQNSWVVIKKSTR